MNLWSASDTRTSSLSVIKNEWAVALTPQFFHTEQYWVHVAIKLLIPNWMKIVFIIEGPLLKPDVM